MVLALDHFFILVKSQAEVAEKLIALGLQEGSSNNHPGQGTANRRFYFSNTMLELLYIRDEHEALNGTAKKLHFVERTNNPAASPFGLIVRRTNNNSQSLPFPGWTYQPEYFKAPQSFHIGNNSELLEEPLCIYPGFMDPKDEAKNSVEKSFSYVSEICLYTPANTFSEVLDIVNNVPSITIKQGPEHLMEISFDDNRRGEQTDLRPDLPLILKY